MSVADETKRVGIWIRVSTEDQVRGESPEHHEKRARAYAEARGWDVVEVFRLDAVSGKAVIGHPEAQRMIALVRAGTITGLVFSKLARLARNTRELLEFAELFREARADLISLHEAIDTSSPAGRLFFTMIAAMAQWEREEIADRVSASVPIRAKMGKPLGGRGPFGYRWDDGKLVVDPAEAPVRVLVHELFLEHRRMKTVATMLNKRGYRTGTGKLFSNTTINRLLHDETAKGTYRGNYSRWDGKERHLKPEGEWVHTAVEPIVSAEVWDECVRIVAQQRVGRKRPTKLTTHLFNGFLHCICGGRMYVSANYPKYRCRTCGIRIPSTDLEAVYREQLHGVLLSEHQLRQHLEAGHVRLREKEILATHAHDELARLLAEDDRLYALYQSGQFTAEDYGRRFRPLAERREQLERELPALQAECDVLRITLASELEAFSEARDLYGQWEQLEAKDKRVLVEAITDKIIVGKEEIEIRLISLPMAEKRGGRGTQPVRCGSQCSRPPGGASQVGREMTSVRQPRRHRRKPRSASSVTFQASHPPRSRRTSTRK
jgi:site-specific DNA recombinase